jgi:GNAT superfamily N-acetyltransferase
MMNEKYEPYDPNHISSQKILKVTLGKSHVGDAESIAYIVAERNGEPVECYFEKIKNQLEKVQNGNDEHLFYSAMINDDIIGFGRLIFHNSNERPDVKDSPTGWWIMGVVVLKKYRGNGVGKQIFTHLESEARRLGGDNLYSFINANNLVSKSLHQKLGFDEISHGSSFLNVKFDGGKGILFRRSL